MASPTTQEDAAVMTADDHLARQPLPDEAPDEVLIYEGSWPAGPNISRTVSPGVPATSVDPGAGGQRLPHGGSTAINRESPRAGFANDPVSVLPVRVRPDDLDQEGKAALVERSSLRRATDDAHTVGLKLAGAREENDRIVALLERQRDAAPFADGVRARAISEAIDMVRESRP